MRAVLFLCLLLLSGVAAAEPLRVAVSVLPQKTFVEGVGGDAVQVQVVVGRGYDPALYQPTPRQLAQLARVQLYVRAGVPFERGWLGRFRQLNPRMEVLDMRQGLPLIPDESGQSDPHVWTDPRLMIHHVTLLRDALIALDPAHAETYRRGHRELTARLTTLDAELERQLAPVKGKSFLVFHPAWSYFARRYGLHQLSVEHEGKAPNARTLARLIDEARRLKIRTILVQPQHPARSARVVADAIGARVVEVDPLSEDYFGTLRRLAAVLTGEEE